MEHQEAVFVHWFVASSLHLCFVLTIIMLSLHTFTLYFSQSFDFSTPMRSSDGQSCKTSILIIMAFQCLSCRFTYGSLINEHSSKFSWILRSRGSRQISRHHGFSFKGCGSSKSTFILKRCLSNFGRGMQKVLTLLIFQITLPIF